VNLAGATALPVTPGATRYGYHGGFFQDSWRVTPKLSLDYGVRYEVPIGWHDVNGNYSTMDPAKPNPGAAGLPGALIFAGVGAGRTGNKRLYPTDFSGIGPRAGFAYRLFDKTVIRGGFGIYYQTLGNGGCGCTDGINGNFPSLRWRECGIQLGSGRRQPRPVSSRRPVWIPRSTISQRLPHGPQFRPCAAGVQLELHFAA